MRAIAASIAKLPPGQLKKILTDDIIAILVKYGVVSSDGSDSSVK